MIQNLLATNPILRLNQLYRIKHVTACNSRLCTLQIMHTKRWLFGWVTWVYNGKRSVQVTFNIDIMTELFGHGIEPE